MLRKKKQNVYFRFGLKPQQGYLVATYVLPRDEHKKKTLSVFYDTALHLPIDVFKIVTTLSNVNKTIELDNSLAHGIVKGSFETDGLSSPLRRVHFDERLDRGYGISQYVYVNEKKEIVYRYPDGYVTQLDYESKTGEETLFGGGISVTYDISSSVNLQLEVIEKIYSMTGEEKEITIILPTRTTSTSRSGTRSDIYDEDEDGIRTLRQTGNPSYGATIGNSMRFGLNQMGTIFIENTRAYLNPLSLEEWLAEEEGRYFRDYSSLLVEIESYTIADKNNEITLPPATYPVTVPPAYPTIANPEPSMEDRVFNYIKPDRVTPTYQNDSVATRFAKNYDAGGGGGNPYPSMIKANDKDAYLMETEGGGCIVVKDGVDHPVKATKFNINGTEYNLKEWEFVDFFCASSMMQCKWFSETRQAGYYEEYPEFKEQWLAENGTLHDFDHYTFTFFNFDDIFPLGDIYDRQYMTASWFGDYLYRVRIDEFIEEPYWTQELDWIINAWDSDYRTNDRNTKKGPAEALGVVGGAFFFDILQKNKTRASYKIIADYMSLYAPIGQMLKIYQPGTNKLWVEKFRLDIKDGTAEIVYVERFQVPFLSPVETQTKAGLDFDIQTTEEYFTRMKSICYVPYDYVPPVDTEN